MDSNTIAKTLLNYKKKIADAEKQKNMLDGAINSLNEQRKRLLGCDKLEDIENKLELLRNNLESTNIKIEEGLSELKGYSELEEYDEDCEDDGY